MVGRGRYVPERGDIVWLQFAPQPGHEQSGRRPALVISPRSYNGKVGLALFCPITSQVKGYPFEVVLPPGGKVAGAILCDQLETLDWRAREAKKFDIAPYLVLGDVLARIATLTG